MNPLSVAVLEDNKDFLLEMVDNLKRTELVNIVIAEQHSGPFIEKVKKLKPEALLLDIHLKDEPSIDGIHVAELLKLPVLFLSAARRDYVDRIDILRVSNTFPVEQFGKIPGTDKLKAILKLFVPRVREFQKAQKVKIKPKGEEDIFITPSDVSFIETIKGTGNHRLNFFSSKPIETANTTFDYFRSNGFLEEKFYKLGKSHLLNISETEYGKGFLKATFKNDKGASDCIILEIPDEKRKEVKNAFQK